MPDDWEWFWAGEGGRANLLRNEIEGLSSQARAARSQAARLSSQLANVSGSLEKRLSTLAAAFDAYVELGDVREQLAGHPDTSAVRRAATAALEALTRGGRPERLPANSVDYWLSDGMNAVIARAAGTPDPAAEDRARTLDRDAELFLVATAGALGQGDQVAARVPPLLVTDGELTPAQRALWAAVLAGEYGEVLPAVREPWQPALDRADGTWPDWVRKQARLTSPLEVLRWLGRLLDAAAAGAGPATTPEPSALVPDAPVPADDLLLVEPAPAGSNGSDARATARTALAAVSLSLIGRGMGEEVALLERARELRTRIEAPEQQPTRRLDRRAPTPDEPVTVVAAVRSAFLAAPLGSPVRAELLRWIQPGLLATVDAVEAEAARSVPEAVAARTPAGAIEVSPSGVTPEQRQQAETRLHQGNHPPPPSTTIAPLVIAGVLLAITVVAGAFGNTTLAVLTALGTAAALGVVGRALLYERRRRGTLRRELEATRTALDQAEARARQLESARQRTVAETRRLAAGLRDRLAIGAGGRAG